MVEEWVVINLGRTPLKKRYAFSTSQEAFDKLRELKKEGYHSLYVDYRKQENV